MPALSGKYEEPDGAPQGAALSQFHGMYTSHSNFMLRKGNFKYCRYNGMEPELFNMADDPDETCNLAGKTEYAGKIAELNTALLALLGDDPEKIEYEIRDNQARRNFIAKAVGTSPIVAEQLKQRIKEFRDFHDSAWWDGGEYMSRYETQFKKT
jgi:arylsulfatase A-like enzyme